MCNEALLKNFGNLVTPEMSDREAYPLILKKLLDTMPPDANVMVATSGALNELVTKFFTDIDRDQFFSFNVQYADYRTLENGVFAALNIKMPSLRQLVDHLKAHGTYRASFGSEDVQISVTLITENQDPRFFDLTTGILGFKTKNIFCRNSGSWHATKVLYKLLKDWQIHSGGELRVITDTAEWNHHEYRPGTVYHSGMGCTNPVWVDADRTRTYE